MSKLKDIEREKGKAMPEILQELYEQFGSQTAIAEKLGVTQGTISLWFLRYGLVEKKTLLQKEATS